MSEGVIFILIILKRLPVKKVTLLILRSILEKSNQIMPIDPAVKPTIKKNANSVKSLGMEFTIKLI